MDLAGAVDRTRDLAAARTHRIITTCTRLSIPVLADLGYLGAGDALAALARRRPGKELTTRQRSLNRARARLRQPAERSIARLKTWRVFRKARCSPTWLTSVTKAILTLERSR